MTDQYYGPSMGQRPTQAEVDAVMAPPGNDLGFEVDLDFGGVDALHGSIPLPDGIYVLRVEKASLVPTNDNQGRMVKLETRAEARVDGGRTDETYAGRGLIDNWYLPDRVRQTPAAFDQTRGFLRGKIEAVTGKEWGQDGMKLNVRELPGLRFKALVVLRDEGKGYGPQNRILRYMPLSEDHSNIPVPQGQTTVRSQQGGAPNNGGAAPAQAAQAGGRFRI